MQNDKLLIYKKHFSWFGFLLFCGSCYGLFVATSAQLSVGYWLSSLAIIISAIILLYRYHWRVIFPSAFLILIIPMWGPLVTILQNISVTAVNFMMGFTGIPTYVEDNLVSIPAGTFEIAGGCSGLRYFIVSIAISSLFVFLNMKNARNIAFFITIAIVGALITNWIRITLLIIIGDYTNMTSSLMNDHNNFGWYIFAPFMVILFIVGNYLTDNDSTACEIKTTIAHFKINKIIILIIALGLFISSTTISKNFITDQRLISVSLKKYSKQKDLVPFIQYFTHMNNSTVIMNNHEILIKTFKFSGFDLDAKPTFYHNKMLPNSWKTNNTFQHKQWNIFEVEQKSQKSLVATTLQVSGQLFANKTKFKIARIKAGLFGVKATQLHWLTLTCNTNCDAEKSILNQALDDFKII